MRNALSGTVLRLWRDERGAIVSAEIVLIMTIAVLSMIVGLAKLSCSLNAELADLAEAFGALIQSFQFEGISGCCASVSGSSFNDHPDIEACDCVPLRHTNEHLHGAEKCE